MAKYTIVGIIKGDNALSVRKVTAINTEALLEDNFVHVGARSSDRYLKKQSVVLEGHVKGIVLLNGREASEGLTPKKAAPKRTATRKAAPKTKRAKTKTKPTTTRRKAPETSILDVNVVPESPGRKQAARTNAYKGRRGQVPGATEVRDAVQKGETLKKGRRSKSPITDNVVHFAKGGRARKRA